MVGVGSCTDVLRLFLAWHILPWFTFFGSFHGGAHPPWWKYMRFTDPGGSEGKASACNAGDLSSIPGSGRSPGEEMATHSSIPAWKVRWQRSLENYSLWGCRESDMTERLIVAENLTGSSLECEWPGGQGFPGKANRSCSPGWGEPTKRNWRIATGVC